MCTTGYNLNTCLCRHAVSDVGNIQCERPVTTRYRAGKMPAKWYERVPLRAQQLIFMVLQRSKPARAV
jgi:hypothetical protein